MFAIHTKTAEHKMTSGVARPPQIWQKTTTWGHGDVPGSLSSRLAVLAVSVFPKRCPAYSFATAKPWKCTSYSYFLCYYELNTEAADFSRVTWYRRSITCPCSRENMGQPIPERLCPSLTLTRNQVKTFCAHVSSPPHFEIFAGK